jgi:IclR family mhp operon transcriptional activator
MDSRRESSIRSIGRGLAVLQVINRHRLVSLVDIAAESRVPYPTACRIVQTLVKEGMVERQGPRRYRPTALVQSLSQGYEPEDRWSELAKPHLEALTARALWPVYMSCRVGMNMVVKASTDSLTSLTISRCNPGYNMPLLESSSGRAYLAFTPTRERDVIIDSALSQEEVSKDITRESLLECLERVRQRGYASVARHTYTENPGKTSAISVPILCGGRAQAALSLLFFASAFDVAAAAKTFLTTLQQIARDIANEMEKVRS